MLWLTVCVALWTFVTGTLGARILAVLPFPGKSNYLYTSAVIQALTGRGHQVVEYSPSSPPKLWPNYTHVKLYTDFDEMKQWKYEDFVHLTEENQNVLGISFDGVWQMLYGISEQIFKNEKIKKLLNSNETFDLVITASTFGQESMLVFGHKFKAPTITLQAFGLWSVLNRAAGNSLAIASNPYFALNPMTNQMTFTERVINVLSTVTTLYKFYNVHLPIHQNIVNKHYPGTPPSVEELVTNVSLYITNSHPAVEYSQPYTPNIVPVAGISLTNERTPLPQDIKNFMDDAKEGVIYFSFGTVVPLYIFPKEILQIFVNVFKKLNIKVIWKIELEDFPGLSSNVILRKWLPQPGILAHPNLKLFLTHGGLNSQLEAIHAGVPTVGIPFFADQPYNVRFNEYYKIGAKVDFKTLSEETLFSALTKVLKDSRYRENAQKMSRIFRDRPVSPADSVVFWTEYVLRHAGARHLQPAAAQLAWYQLWLLDVVVAVTLALPVIMFIMYIVISKLISVLERINITKTKKVI